MRDLMSVASQGMIRLGASHLHLGGPGRSRPLHVRTDTAFASAQAERWRESVSRKARACPRSGVNSRRRVGLTAVHGASINAFLEAVMAHATLCRESAPASPDVSDLTPDWKLVNRVLAMAYSIQTAADMLSDKTFDLPAMYQDHLWFLANTIHLMATEIVKAADTLDLRSEADGNGESE